jgi:hypothetical protein
MMKTKFGLVTVFVIVSMLLTACSISITTKVNADGSGELGFAYKFTKDDLSQLSGMGMSSDTICSDLESQGGSDMPADFAFKQETHGNETWCVGAKTFDNLDDLRNEISGEGFTINTMEISDGTFVFDAVADMSGTDTGGMPFSITIDYDLTAPGSIDKGKSNADDYSGNTATWNLALTGSKDMHLESSTKGGGGGGVSLGGDGKVLGIPTWVAVIVLLCCCLLVIIIIVVVVYLVMKRKPKQPGM